MTLSQLALGVRLRDDARWSNFYGERNARAAALLREACDSHSGGNNTGAVVVVCGDSDTGKSHLLQAACHQAEQSGQQAVCLGMAELLVVGPGALAGLDELERVALDDLHLVAGRLDWEEAVFHLFNRLQDRDRFLLISLADTPARCGFQLPDLRSRLQLGLQIQLGVYRDEDRLSILKARAEERGLVLSDDVAAYILKRASRRLADLLGLLDRLDENSLQAQRRLTIPFVKSVLDW